MRDEQRPQESKGKKPRLRLQFSLQTMLILTLGASLVCAWLLTPRLRETTLGGGALRIRGQWSGSDVPVNSTSPAPEAPAAHGRWLLYDRYGAKRVQGSFHHGQPSGYWRYFDVAGREVLSGAVRHGQMAGPWTARHADRQISHQVTYDQQEVVRISEPNWQSVPTEIRAWDSVRSGSARQNWQNGHARVQGQYIADRREGTWTFFNRDGQKAQEGTYRHGKKHGAWRRWDTVQGEPATEWFLAGKKIDHADALLARLADDLLGDDPLPQVRAARSLEQFGAAAVPALRKTLDIGDCQQQLLAIRTLKHLGPAASAAADDLAAIGRGEDALVKFNSLVALAEVDPLRAEEVFAQLLSSAADDGRDDRDLLIECLAQAGAAGLEQLGGALDDPRPAVRLAAFDVIARMYIIHVIETSVRGAPSVDTEKLKVICHRAAKHSDPDIRARVELFWEVQHAHSHRQHGWPGGMF